MRTLDRPNKKRDEPPRIVLSSDCADPTPCSSPPSRLPSAATDAGTEALKIAWQRRRDHRHRPVRQPGAFPIAMIVTAFGVWPHSQRRVGVEVGLLEARPSASLFVHASEKPAHSAPRLGRNVGMHPGATSWSPGQFFDLTSPFGATATWTQRSARGRLPATRRKAAHASPSADWACGHASREQGVRRRCAHGWRPCVTCRYDTAPGLAANAQFMTCFPTPEGPPVRRRS